MTKLRRLHFDTEAQPGHWIGGDYVSKLLTAVAWAWDDKPDDVTVLTHFDTPPAELALKLGAELVAADIVTGHYIRGFDLPLINGQLLSAGYGSLPRLMTVDTKLDLVRSHGRSLSQKNLAGQLGVEAPKVDLTLYEWEQFNDRIPGSEYLGVARVIGDVRQHIQMYGQLVEHGWLQGARAWTPITASKGYRP
jgi:hypothetical protein